MSPNNFSTGPLDVAAKTRTPKRLTLRSLAAYTITHVTQIIGSRRLPSAVPCASMNVIRTETHRFRTRSSIQTIPPTLCLWSTECKCAPRKQKKSAKLTDQRGSCAFTCSPLRIHVRHILPTFNIDILVYFLQTPANTICESCAVAAPRGSFRAIDPPPSQTSV